METLDSIAAFLGMLDQMPATLDWTAEMAAWMVEMGGLTALLRARLEERHIAPINESRLTVVTSAFPRNRPTVGVLFQRELLARFNTSFQGITQSAHANFRHPARRTIASVA